MTKSSEKHLQDFYLELCATKSSVKTIYPEEKIIIDEEKMEKKVKEGKNLLDFAAIDIDQEWLKNFSEKILFLIERFNVVSSKNLKNLKKVFQKKEMDLKILTIKAFILDKNYLDGLARRSSLEVDLLLSFGINLAAPIWELYARKVKSSFDPESWQNGFCPVCGTPPSFAYLRKDDGKRILWCRMCQTEWSFARIKCPFCFNEDQNTLRYFFTEEESPYRVAVCDKCKRYLKTIDLRKTKEGEEIDLSWENLKTLSFDFLAEKDGYGHPLNLSTIKKGGVFIAK